VSAGTCGARALDAARALAEAGFAADVGLSEAHLLARAALGWDHATWLSRKNDVAPDTFSETLAAWVQRRISREPIAYILGRREFYGRDFRVTPDVLVPRPETELIVEEALRWLAERQRTATVNAAGPVAVLDVGTGSGCLAITLALERPEIQVMATDVSPAALAVATSNAATWAVASRVTFQLASLTGAAANAFDLVVSNPPYVPVGDHATLPLDVRDHEPPMALVGGVDGLDVVRQLLPAAAGALRPGGRLLCEIGFGQVEEVARLIDASGLHWRGARPDLAGIPRVVVADRPDAPL